MYSPSINILGVTNSRRFRVYKEPYFTVRYFASHFFITNSFFILQIMMSSSDKYSIFSFEYILGFTKHVSISRIFRVQKLLNCLNSLIHTFISFDIS